MCKLSLSTRLVTVYLHESGFKTKSHLHYTMFKKELCGLVSGMKVHLPAW